MNPKLVLHTKTFLQSTRQVSRLAALALLALLALALTPAAWGITTSFITPGTNDWVVPANVTNVTIECRGAGGAGGAVIRAFAANVRGGGAAGGSYALKTNLTVVPGTTLKVIVGAGGVSVTNGVTDGSVLPGQSGGDSRVADATFTTEHAKAVGGAGGTNAVTSVGVINAGGNIGFTTGCVGDVFYAGGNGGAAGSLATGAGGGGAGDAAAGGNASGGTAGAGGVAGGGLGAAGAGNNANGLAGVAPGGGGSGGSRTSGTGTTSSIGGAGGAGKVVLSYVVNTGIAYFEVSAGSPQIAGTNFNVTITAKDGSNNTVNDSINTVTLTSPQVGNLMEFDANGDGTYGDNSSLLTNGVTVIRARDKKAETVTLVASLLSLTTPTPPSVTINPAAFAKLQILAPGETNAPATTTGKTGTPSAQTVGTSFNVTVNAVDAFWNVVPGVIDTVAFTSTPAAATLPANAPLVMGTGTFAVTFNAVGVGFTVTATDFTDGTKTASTTSGLTVQGVPITWQGDRGANQWNTLTANWTNAAGAPVTFANNNQVTYDNTSTNLAVDIVGTVAPWSITVNSTNSYILSSTGSGLIGGTLGGLTKQGTNTLTLATSNTFSGPTTVSAGSIILSNYMALQNSALVTAGGSSPKLIVVDDGITPVSSLTLGGLSGASGNMATIISGYAVVTELTLNLISGATNSYGGVIANGASGMTLKKTGAGTQVLSGASTYTGNTLIQNGTVVISGGNDRFPNNALVTLGDGLTSGVLQLGDAGGARNQTVFSLATSGTGTGNKVVGGSTNVSTLTLNIPSALSLGGGLLGGAGPNENNLGLTKSGNGTLNLSGVNTYAGPTTVSAGLLQLDSANAVPGGIGASGGTSALILGSGVLGLATGNFTRAVGTNIDQVNMSGNPPGFAAFGANRIVNLGGASAQLYWNSNNFMTGGSTLVLGHLNADSTVDFQNPVVLSGTRFFRADNGPATVDAKLSGAITGSTTFSKNGTGTLMISNPGNAWTGTAYVDSGTLMLGASEVIPGNLVVKRANATGSTDGVLDLNGFNETVSSLTLGESGPDINNANQTPSVINSSAAPATLTLGGTLTYAAGGTNNQNGQATISANLATGNTGTTNRNINVGDSTFVTDPTPELLISGAISGGGVITKQGLGTLALSGTNTCTADVTVSAGKLAITENGSLNNVPNLAVATGTNATLDVSGLYSGALTLTANQTLKSSGTNVGPINVTGNLTVGSGRILLALNRANSPTTNDTLAVSGTFTPGGTLAVTNIGPALVVGDSFQLFPGAISGFSVVNLQTNDVANNLIYTWNNTLSSDGKITVATVTSGVNPLAPSLQVSVSGNTLSLAWPTNKGWTLLTNSVSLTVTNQWFPYPNSANLTNVNIPMDPTKTNVFFKMQYPYP